MNDSEILKNKTILYVEDDLLTIELVKRIIQKEVKEVVVANNGEDGLRVYLEKKPDIVITDIEMPIMNGIDMIKEIRKNSSSEPIIILTAYEEESYNANNIANVVLIKPINRKLLKETMINCFK